MAEKTPDSSKSYCPYCNQWHPPENMSEEHIIPRAIGGPDMLTISVCKPCNDRMGRTLDSRLDRHGWLKFAANFYVGVGVSRHQRQRGFAELHDGTKLQGYFSTEEVEG